MSVKQLYRPEALNARQANWLGQIVLVRPITFSFLSAIAAAMACVILVFLFFGSYTKRAAVAGLLLPDLGLVKVYVPQFGIVERKNVVEGQAVKRGDVLYVLSVSYTHLTLPTVPLPAELVMLASSLPDSAILETKATVPCDWPNFW